MSIKHVYHHHHHYTHYNNYSNKWGEYADGTMMNRSSPSIHKHRHHHYKKLYDAIEYEDTGVKIIHHKITHVHTSYHYWQLFSRHHRDDDYDMYHSLNGIPFRYSNNSIHHDYDYDITVHKVLCPNPIPSCTLKPLIPSHTPKVIHLDEPGCVMAYHILSYLGKNRQANEKAIEAISVINSVIDDVKRVRVTWNEVVYRDVIHGMKLYIGM